MNDNYIEGKVSNSFQADVDFMKKYTEIIVLESDNSRLAVCSSLQGRVMTSSSNGDKGRSYGWINKELFASEKTVPHMNAYGGEERFWLGPEGGQFSIFFEKGAEFNFDNWQTPRLIDLDAYDVISKENGKVAFKKEASLTNYSGFTFDIDITREVAILTKSTIIKQLKLNGLNGVNVVGYQTTNALTNIGNADWEKETGLLSIWLLGMFNPSETTTVVLPYIAGNESELGVEINIYESFGELSTDRLITKEDVAYFKGDGKYRSKVGLLPIRAKNVIGSYDSTNNILTIVKYNKPEGVTEYVNSTWKLQEAPYEGDVVNSYNDGAPTPEAKPMGPFYELETSSPALALKIGEKGIHIQNTYHFEGDKELLNTISKKVLGVSLKEIEEAF